jgi:hypothetical protein
MFIAIKVDDTYEDFHLRNMVFKLAFLCAEIPLQLVSK